MIFCPKCSSILRLKEKAGKKVLWCDCGFTAGPEKTKKSEAEEIVDEKTLQGTRRLEVMEEVEVRPKVKATCEKCGCLEAYYWSQQTRSADEPETRFFKCVKCEHTWREYS